MTQFTPWSAAAGGALIGAAAALLWVALGRIAGISGILGGLAGAPAGERGWRLAFLAGLVAAPLLCRRGASARRTARSRRDRRGSSWPGCSSASARGSAPAAPAGTASAASPGSRRARSRRPATFMATAAATVFVVRHVLGS